MASDKWTAKPIPVASLHLDPKNPRLGRETTARAPREIIQYLFDHDKAMEVAESIAYRGYFPNEPLLAVKKDSKLVVVEGNRRLAALKALREPGLLQGSHAKKVSRLSRRVTDIASISKAPVVTAPNRRSTDRQVAGRHVGTPVLAWQAENRASFILDKLDEGYTNDELRDDLGFTLQDIQKARQTRAIADMSRSLDLAEEVKAKLDNPRAKVFTTIERVFESTVGREYLMVEPDAEHGIRGNTTKKEFIRGLARLVSDVALGKQSSRSLNTNDNIRSYFESWDPRDRPSRKRGSFVPAEIIAGKSTASSVKPGAAPKKPVRSKQTLKTVLPKDLKVRYGGERLADIRRELIKLKREDYPNAGAVLLRVFFELTVLDYLKRTGELDNIIKRLKEKHALRHDVPEMKQLVPEVVRIAKAQLTRSEANQVEKAIKYDAAAPFSISDLHSFVHQPSDLPGARDILQFWLRTEPLFRLMLEQDPVEAEA